MCQISSGSVYSVALFLPFFGLRHLVLSPIGNSLTKLNTGAQLQKIVSVLQRLHGDIGRRISDVQKRDGQTDKQAGKKLNVFGCPGGGINPSPTELGTVIEDLERVLSPPKLLGSDA